MEFHCLFSIKCKLTVLNPFLKLDSHISKVETIEDRVSMIENHENNKGLWLWNMQKLELELEHTGKEVWANDLFLKEGMIIIAIGNCTIYLKFETCRFWEEYQKPKCSNKY